MTAMRTLAIFKNLVLILLLTVAASGTVNAKLASGPQTLGPDLHQAASGLEAAPRLGWSASSYDGVSESPVVTRGAGPLARGRASETRVLNDLGLPKNTQRVRTAEGASVPDALTRTRSIEIKDTLRVDRTRQVRIQTEAAQRSGRESVLITGEQTCVSGPCAEAFDVIIRRPDLGPP